MIKLTHDFYNNIEVPQYILSKANGDRIAPLKCSSKKYTKKFNAYDEISFTVHMYVDNERNEWYDKVKDVQYIELPNIGRFVINNITTQSESTEYEYKECNALSEEVLLDKK